MAMRYQSSAKKSNRKFEEASSKAASSDIP